MIILQAAHIDKSYGAAPVLKDATLTIQDRERAGLVGANGAGKSTLLRIINGEIEPDQGQVSKSKEISMGYLSQDSGLESGNTVWEEMLAAFGPLQDQERELRELEAKMGDPVLAKDKKIYRQVSARYATLSDLFQHAGGYTYKATASSVLQGLSFVEDDHHKIVSTLSGGQKTRLALARQLMLQPDLLILDEPTNYLDIETMDWLEKYLQSYPGALLVVSHDRYFLDNLVNVVYELENSILIKYEGNYTRFLHQKALRLEQQAREYEQYRTEKARLEDFVRRNIADKATVGRAKARRKQLEKMQPVEQPFNGLKKAKMTFNILRPSGKEVLAVRDLAIGYNSQAVATNISFDLNRGERTAILGPNGAGKTTLIKTIAGQLSPLGGTIKEGHHLYPAYHDQELQSLSDDKTVQEELWDAYPDLDEKDVRGILGRFLFPGENVRKKVSALSGGERARLTLAKLLCAGANLLILDEPTNHLDVYSKEVLEDALLDYPGTLLLVSHDRYFLNRIATRIIELTPTGLTIYEGNFDYYQEKKKPPAVEEKKPEKQPKEESEAKSHYLQTKDREREERKRQRRLEELESLIEKTEADIATLETELFQPEVYSDHELCQQKSTLLDQLRTQQDTLLEEWLTFQETS